MDQKNELQRLIHDFRKQTEAIMNNVKTLKDNPATNMCAREIAIAITKLQEAKNSLGNALEETGLTQVFTNQEQTAVNTPSQPLAPVQPQTQPGEPLPPTEQPAQPAPGVQQPGTQPYGSVPGQGQQPQQ